MNATQAAPGAWPERRTQRPDVEARLSEGWVGTRGPGDKARALIAQHAKGHRLVVQYAGEDGWWSEGGPSQIRAAFEAARLDLLCAGYARMPVPDIHHAATPTILRRFRLVRTRGVLASDTQIARRDWPPASMSAASVGRQSASAVIRPLPAGHRLLIHVDNVRRMTAYGHEQVGTLGIEFDQFRTAFDLGAAPLLVEILAANGGQRAVAVDLLVYAGKDIRSLPWSRRNSMLRQLLGELDDVVASLWDQSHPPLANEPAVLIEPEAPYGRGVYALIGGHE